MQQMAQATTLPLLNEADVRLFLQEAPNFKQELKKFTMGFSIALGLVVAVFGIVNYGALLRLYTTPTQASAIIISKPTTPVKAVSTPAPTPVPTPAIPSIPENTVNFAPLSIAAPIIWDTPVNDTALIQERLKNGVIHIKGTAKPGEKGFVVISGHSSNYPWIKGSYNTIFAPLPKAQVGETIAINYQNIEYTYTITKMYEVKPTDLSVLRDQSEGGLRLITCTPIGTSLRRLVIEAVQTSPSPTNNHPFTPESFNGTIPGAR